MTDGNGDTIKIPLPFGGEVSAKGTLVVGVLLLLAVTYFCYLQHLERAQEHAEITNSIHFQTCVANLNLYVLTHKDAAIELKQLPVELWGCLPKFLTEEKR